MFACLVGIGTTYEDHCGFIFDCTERDEFNVMVETPNYYDENGVACLTAREAGCYTPKEELFLMYDDDSDILFQIVEDEKADEIVREVFRAKINGEEIKEDIVMQPDAHTVMREFPEVDEATTLRKKFTHKNK